jgi:proline dehydrogenase
VGRRVAGRFVAGETLEDAMGAAAVLNRASIASMLDHLGENVISAEQASAAADQYVLALKRLREAEDIDGNISVKLTQLGLDLSYELCLENAERVLATAAETSTQVMLDMEASEYVDATLRAHRELEERFPRVGVCLQAALRRTADDVAALPEASTIRLVKGAYLELPTVAYSARRDVDRNFSRLFATLAARGHTIHVATHDPRLVDGARAFAVRRGIAWTRIEFQMLYGIRRDLQQRLARDNYPVRVYIPYGSEWYPYLTRRLAERPANLWFFVQNLVRGSR